MKFETFVVGLACSLLAAILALNGVYFPTPKFFLVDIPGVIVLFLISGYLFPPGE
jgi:hypothetical protein